MTEINLKTAGRDGSTYTPELECLHYTVNGKDRSVYLYIGKAFVVANPIIFIYTPAGCDIHDFAESMAGWKKRRSTEIFLYSPRHTENGLSRKISNFGK